MLIFAAMAGASPFLDQACRVFSSLDAGASKDDADSELSKLSTMVGSELGAFFFLVQVNNRQQF